MYIYLYVFCIDNCNERKSIRMTLMFTVLVLGSILSDAHFCLFHETINY